MSVFQPDIRNIADTGVPVVCPACQKTTKLDGLSDVEKQYLIDATRYHDLRTEFRHLVAMLSIVERYPGTQHPLLRGKLTNPGQGFTDESKVAELLRQQPELSEFLRQSSFKLDGRFSFVRDAIYGRMDSIYPILVECGMCPIQYLVLPFDYFMTIG